MPSTTTTNFLELSNHSHLLFFVNLFRSSSAQAKLAEEAERYDDMVVSVKSLAELHIELSVEVRR